MTQLNAVLEYVLAVTADVQLLTNVTTPQLAPLPLMEALAMFVEHIILLGHLRLESK